MTNAEKLAKDTDAMECMIYAMCATRASCLGCPVHTNCGSGTGLREWLEQEVEDDVEIR